MTTFVEPRHLELINALKPDHQIMRTHDEQQKCVGKSVCTV